MVKNTLASHKYFICPALKYGINSFCPIYQYNVKIWWMNKLINALNEYIIVI